MKDEIKNLYKQDNYIRSMLPYRRYFDALEQVLDFSIIESFIDIGCNNGRLIEAIKRRRGNVMVAGIDIFKWAQECADPLVKDQIKLIDLSQKQNWDKQYDIVNCTEVGEHLEKESEQVFLDNIVGLTKDILIVTWSNTKNDQHFNPRPKKYIIKELEKRDLTYCVDLTKIFKNSLEDCLLNVGYQWWAEDIMIFKRLKFAKVDSRFIIQGIQTDDASHHLFFNSSNKLSRTLQESFMFLINSIKIKVNSGGNLSVLRLGDGDYYFLRQIPLGSAKPGRRALTKSYENLPMSIFLKRMWQNDFICPEVTPHNYKMWHGYVFYEFFDKILDEFKINFQNNKTAAPVKVVFDKIFGWLISRPVWLRIFVWLVSLRKKGGYYQKAISLVNKTYMPMEVIYALVSTKLIFRNYPDKIALIGAKEKLDVIKELVKKEEYKKYLGIEKFVDYIDVPQVGAADNIDELVKNTGMQVAKSSARIFLVAAGSAKLGFLSELKEYKDAIYIDIGCGMDALAGIVCQDRPYFASWVNYRLGDYNYDRIDFMDKGNPAWDKKEYKTIYLD